MKRKMLYAFVSLVAVGALTSYAQDKTPAPQDTKTAAAAPAATPVAPISGFRAEFLKEMATVENHFVSLAESVPAEKYAWRPGEGVRSIGEVFLHVAGANYNLPRLVGTPPPAGFKPQGFDTSMTDKAKIVETLKQSFAHLRQAAMNISDADADKTFDMFGGKNTYRGGLLFMTRHLAEHLGQSIAYARMNGVVPPWTEEQQRMRQQQQQQTQPPQKKP